MKYGIALVVCLLLATVVLGADMKMSGKPSDAKLIAMLTKAAPPSIGKDATVIDMSADGSMRTLRQGKNGFTCMPDSPKTKAHPMCLDANAMEWAKAWMSHQNPPAGKVGFVYMLAGDTGVSNTDPFADKPTPTNHWVTTGPHVMVVGADASFYDSYPKSADPDTKMPYVMWPGTPYQHLMAPVK